MSDEAHQLHEPLTDRELEILGLIAAGLTNQQIADQLFLTVDTVKWHNKQSYQKLYVNNRTQAVARARDLGLLEPLSEPQVSPRAKNNLPTQTTPFIGREEDLGEIKRLVLDEPGCRLLTLIGPGGIGKTRLALAAAVQMMDVFPNGVYFVSLAVVDDITFIAPAIADALHFLFTGETDPSEQLLDYLEDKKLLLVLDNFEHLLEGAQLLTTILKRATDVTLLATSREPLHLQEEWNYEVLGLPYPVGETTALNASDFGTFQAVQLFVQRARQADAGFTPVSGEIADIARICQLVEGMPLGLELAAPWIRSLSCHDIALEIEHNLDFLTTPLRNLPERHRSLRAVIEQTWHRLTPAEQSALSQLSVFRGGCTRQAAETVTGAALGDLVGLIDKALLRRTDTGRYEVHELVRQFAEEQLQADPDAVQQTQRRHYDYFIAFLEARTGGVKGNRQKETLAEIKADMDNVRLIWRQAVATQDAGAFERTAECLFVFYLYSSGHYEGQTVFQQAAAAFIDGTDLKTSDGLPDKLVVLDNQENLAAYLLASQAYFLGRTRDPYTGQTLLEQALTLLKQAEIPDRRTEGFILLWLAWMVDFQGKPDVALTYVEAIVSIFSETNDRWAQGFILILWANLLRFSQPLEADEIYKKGLAVCQESGDRNMVGYMSQMRSSLNLTLGRYAKAQQMIDEAISIFEAMGNVLGLGYALTRRGELATFLGEYQQAIHDLQDARGNFNEVRTEQNVAWTKRNLGHVFRLLEDYDRAEHFYRQSLEVSNPADAAECLLGLGCVAYDRGGLRQAEQYHREALAFFEQMEFEARLAEVFSHLGRALVASGKQRHEEGRRYFRQALELAATHQLAPIALDVCISMAHVLVTMDHEEQALELATFTLFRFKGIRTAG